MRPARGVSLHLFVSWRPTFRKAPLDRVHGDTISLLKAWNETNYTFNGSDTFLSLNHLGTTATLEFAGYVPGLQVHSGTTTTITRV